MSKNQGNSEYYRFINRISKKYAGSKVLRTSFQNDIAIVAQAIIHELFEELAVDDKGQYLGLFKVLKIINRNHHVDHFKTNDPFKYKKIDCSSEKSD